MASGVDFFWNSSLRGVDRSGRSPCNGGDIVSAEKSKGKSSYSGACRLSVLSPRPKFTLNQNKDNGASLSPKKASRGEVNQVT